MNVHKVLVLNKACDGDGCAGAGMIWDKAEGHEAQFGDGAVEFHKSVCTHLSFANDDHGTEVVGVGFAAEGGLDG